MPRFWIGIASLDHVSAGVAAGFAQLGHGKAAPVLRLQKGDWIVYYSPRTSLVSGSPVQAFTAIGEVLDEAPKQVQQSDGFHPFRRSVRFLKCRDAPMAALLEKLSFTRGRKDWGRLFHRASFQISEDDFAVIRDALLAAEA